MFNYLKLLLILTLIPFVACTQTEKKNSNSEQSEAQEEITEVKEISIDEFKKLMVEENAVVVDVREPSELAESGYIENAINVPAYKIEKLFTEKVNADKDAIILTYCLSGYRSGVASEELIKMGYKNVYSLRGGFSAWSSNNLPVVK